MSGSICSGIEGLCIFLKQLAYPCRYPDMAICFGRNPTEICLIWLIFNKVLDLVYDAHHHHLESWNQPFFHQSCSKIVLMQYMIRVPHWKTALDLSMALFAQLLDRNTTSDKCTMVTRGSITLNFKVLCCLMVLLITLLGLTKVKDTTVQCFVNRASSFLTAGCLPQQPTSLSLWWPSLPTGDSFASTV